MQDVINEMYEYWINEAYDWYDKAYGCVEGTEEHKEAMDKYYEAKKKAQAFLEDDYVKLVFEHEALKRRFDLFYELMHTPCGSKEDKDALDDMCDRCSKRYNDVYKKKHDYEKQVLAD